MRCRSLLIQICDAEDVQILKGVISKDHVHMHLEYRPSQRVSDLVKKLKGRSSRKLQQEFLELQ
jgi:putative transposase